MQLAVEEANYLVHMKNEERVKSSMYIVQGYSFFFVWKLNKLKLNKIRFIIYFIHLQWDNFFLLLIFRQVHGYKCHSNSSSQ